MTIPRADEWVAKAEDAYLSALDLSRRRSRPVPDVVCNLCHQSVEKYLKALYVAIIKAERPRVHDLIHLETLLHSRLPDVRLIHNELTTLNGYGVAVRYPGYDTTGTDAAHVTRAMRVVRKFVRTRLRLK